MNPEAKQTIRWELFFWKHTCESGPWLFIGSFWNFLLEQTEVTLSQPIRNKDDVFSFLQKTSNWKHRKSWKSVWERFLLLCSVYSHDKCSFIWALMRNEGCSAWTLSGACTVVNLTRETFRRRFQHVHVLLQTSHGFASSRQYLWKRQDRRRVKRWYCVSTL